MYSKKRKLSPDYYEKTSTKLVPYRNYPKKSVTTKKTTVKRTYTVSPYAFFTGREELKAFDFWDNNTNNTPIRGTQGFAYNEFGDGIDSISAGGYICINRIAAGTGNSQRVGNKIVMKRIDVSFSAYATDQITVANGNSFTYRYAIIYDKNCGGSAATASELFAKEGMVSGTSTTVNDYPCVYNLGSRLLFLKDGYWTADNAKLVKHVNLSINCSLPVTYTGTQATISVTNIGQGALYFVVVACTNANPGKGYAISFARTRVYYDDK